MDLSFIYNPISMVYNKIERYLRKMPVWIHLLILLVFIFILVSIFKHRFRNNSFTYHVVLAPISIPFFFGSTCPYSMD